MIRDLGAIAFTSKVPPEVICRDLALGTLDFKARASARQGVERGYSARELRDPQHKCHPSS